MSMVINNIGYFDKVAHFAVANGCLLKLAERIDYLSRYGDGECVCQLYPDFTPNSFTFTMLRPNGEPWFAGGLIYSGGPDIKHSWSVHT